MLWGLKGRLAREARTNSKEKGSSEKAPPLNHRLSLPIYSRPEPSLQGTWTLLIFLRSLPATKEDQLAGWSLQGLWESQKLCPLPRAGSHIPHFLQLYEQGQKRGYQKCLSPSSLRRAWGLLLSAVTQIGLMPVTKETLSVNPGAWGLCQWHWPAGLILQWDSSSKGPTEIFPSFLSTNPSLPNLTPAGPGGLKSPTACSSNSVMMPTWQPPALRSQRAMVMGRDRRSPVSEVSHGPRVWHAKEGP